MFYDPKSVLIEIIRRYPDESVIKNSFLTFALYLVDWHHAVQYDCTVTQIQWMFNRNPLNVGDPLPYCPPVCSYLGFHRTQLIPFIPPVKKRIAEQFDLSEHVRASVNHVVTSVVEAKWEGIKGLVENTYPICCATSEKKGEGKLDLVKIAKKFNKLNLSTRDKGFV